MRRAAPLLALTLLAIPVAVVAGTQPSFDPAAVRAHVTFLADDALDGRGSGTKGYGIAANYVATQFMALGAMPMGDAAKGSYFQQVPLREAKLVGQPVLTISGKGKTVRLDSTEQMLIGPNMLETQQAIEAPLVFVGYGMDRPELGLNDYAKLDVKGKVVVVLSGFPKGLNSEIGAHLNSDKARMAMNRGAIGVLTVPTRQDIKRRPWERRMETAGEPRSAWVKADGAAFQRAPGIRADALLHPDMAALLFGTGKQSLAAILTEADKDGGRPRSFAMGLSAKLERNSEFRAYSSPNVVAMIPGSDPSVANEYVLMTAHLDHIGDHAKGADKISNGAMDNAAGVATMIEVANALAKDGKRPRRPILFAAVTSEESGLLGSDYLAQNPVNGSGRVVAVVNFDMPILTYQFSDVIAFGAENSTLGPVVAKASAQAGIALSPDPVPEEGFFTRSDHYRFVQQGIPSLFLVTGRAGPGQAASAEFLDKHYHRPSDDLNLPINWAAGAKFAEVNYYIVRAIADEGAAPQWYSDSFFGREFAPKSAKAMRLKL
jgi:Zn-dependent M28 family amino/carboxypeptidase